MSEPQPSLIKCRTSAGTFVVEVRPDWSPNGASRFIDLASRGYYNGVHMFRKNHWIVQFGAVQHPQKGWRRQFSGLRTVPDDPPTDCSGKCIPNKLWDGALSFAGGGTDSRSDQVFIVHHLGSQPIGKSPWETPIGNVTEGLDVVRKMYGGYGEKVSQVKIFARGDEFIREEFPLLDRIFECRIADRFFETSQPAGCTTPHQECDERDVSIKECLYPDALQCKGGHWMVDSSRKLDSKGKCCRKRCRFICSMDQLPSCEVASADCPGFNCVRPARESCDGGIWTTMPQKLILHQEKCCHEPCQFQCSQQPACETKSSDHQCPHSSCSAMSHMKWDTACKEMGGGWTFSYLPMEQCCDNKCERFCEIKRAKCSEESDNCEQQSCSKPPTKHCLYPARWELRKSSADLFWRLDGKCCTDDCSYVCVRRSESVAANNEVGDSLNDVTNHEMTKENLSQNIIIVFLLACGVYMLVLWMRAGRVKRL